MISIKDSNNTIVTIDIMTLLMTEGDLKKEKNILMKDSQTKHISTIAVVSRLRSKCTLVLVFNCKVLDSLTGNSKVSWDPGVK